MISKKTNKKAAKSRQPVVVHSASIKLLVDATWDFAYSQLWEGFTFNKAEINLSKIFIRQFYEGIPAEKFSALAHKHFSAYCQRILLARQYVSRFAHRFIPHPCIWLNKTNPKGFAGTKQWYLENLKKQKQTAICKSCHEKFILDSIMQQVSHF